MPIIETETAEGLVEIEFEVYCNNCGEGLCYETTVENFKRKVPTLYINPCSVCLQKEKEEGFGEGYKEGYDAGYMEALNKYFQLERFMQSVLRKDVFITNEYL